MQKILFILNDGPYGTERAYQALRQAQAVGKQADVAVRMFLLSDAVQCARSGQKVPSGYYNLERMLRVVVQQGAEVGACGTCLEARGLTDTDLVAGVHRGSLEELAVWTLWADKVIGY